MDGTERETRLQELEAELHRTRGALGRRAAELEEYSYTISHDLRAPLRHIEGYVELLRRRLGLQRNEEIDDILDRIAAAARKMDELTQDVLVYIKVGREAPMMIRVELELAVAEILEKYPECRKASIRVVHPLLCVLGSAALVDQVVSNLLVNAVKFVARDCRPEIEISTEPRKEKVRLWVKDNGIGVDAKLQEKIFRPFERAPEAKNYPGSGIGLAIVKKAAERMGGRVGVESAPGEGSRFWVELRGEHSHGQNHPRR